METDPPGSKRPNDEEIRDALDRSGYLLESRVERALRAHALTPIANVAYQDPDTGKSREIDLRAHGIHKDIDGPDEFENLVWADLVVECVHSPQPIAFFVKERPVEWDHGLERIKVAGPPVQEPPEKLRYNWYWLALEMQLHQHHHYFRGSIASQYCSFEQKKSGEWFATHRDQDYEVFRKLAAATEFGVQDQYDHMDPAHYPWSFQLAFFYPLLVVQGDLLTVTEESGSLKIEPAAHIGFHLARAVGREEHRYHVDIVTEAHLPAFLQMVDSDLTAIAEQLRGKGSSVQMRAEKRRSAMLAGKQGDLYP